MTKSWDEVQENPSALPEAGRALHPSHDAQEHLMHGQHGGKVPHMMLRRFCLAFCRAEPLFSSLAFAFGKIRSPTLPKGKKKKVFYDKMQNFAWFALFSL